MRLREKLLEILPEILPAHPQNAIKGKELIARLRAQLGEDYSDQTLRSQFSFLVLDEDSCLARVENGQGYYLRSEEESNNSLHRLFESGEGLPEDSPHYQALALGVRSYDTAGAGVFVYPVDEEESWMTPDFVAVQWPRGHWEKDGSYSLLPNQSFEERWEQLRLTAVCVGEAGDEEQTRRAFFRALSCGAWAHGMELLLWGELEEGAEATLRALASEYGIGINLREQLGDYETDYLFRAPAEQLREQLCALPQRRITLAAQRGMRLPDLDERADIAALISWAQGCLKKGRIESYEQRVAVQ